MLYMDVDKPDFERLYAVLHLEEPMDRIPFYDLFADPEVIEAITRDELKLKYADIYSIARSILKGDSKYVQALEQDMVLQIKFYTNLGYDYVVLQIPSPFPRTNIILAEDVAPLKRPKRSWQDEYRGVIESRDDFEKYPWPDLSEIQDIFILLYNTMAKHLPENVMIIPLTPGGVLENVMWLMGFVPFSKALRRDRKLVEDMFRQVGKVISFFCKISAEQEKVGAMSMGDDMGYKKGPFLSPDILRELVFPWQRECAANVHRYGKPFILHSCGNLRIVMEDLINYVGIDAKHSFEDTSYPVTEYKELYGDRIAILGGVDMDKLSRAPQDEFVEYVKDVIRRCAPGGGYALGCGNTVANYVKLENYLAMIRIGKKYGRYPVKRW